MGGREGYCVFNAVSLFECQSAEHGISSDVRLTYLGQWKKVLKSVSGTMEEGAVVSLFKYQSAEHVISSDVRLVHLGQWKNVLQSDFSNASQQTA